MSPKPDAFDVIIAGAGPVGLALARSLSDTGLRLAIVDPQPLEALKQPAWDGREIALTHPSMDILKGLGVWDRIAEADRSDLRQARVTNGKSSRALSFDSPSGERLGVLVSNHLIRQALFDLTEHQPNLTLMSGRRIVQARIRPASPQKPVQVEAQLDDGHRLTSSLIVAADSRFSSVRQMLGVGADLHNLGRSIIVCRVRHEKDHEHVATEGFDHGQILAFLPLNPDAEGHRSSVVLTLDNQTAQGLMEASDEAFEADLIARAAGRLGQMSVISPRRLYPQAISWSHSFSGEGYALVGDAAVGMNPITAHGFNLGLKGQDRLARQIKQAAAKGLVLGRASTLRGYDHGHRLDALPLYRATNTIAHLFTDETLPAKALRQLVLNAGQALPPFRRAVSHSLMGKNPLSALLP